MQEQILKFVRSRAAKTALATLIALAYAFQTPRSRAAAKTSINIESPPVHRRADSTSESENMHSKCVSLILCALALIKISSAAKTDSKVIAIDAPTTEFLQGYLAWAHQHPQSFPKAGADGSKHIMLPMTLVELFSPEGKLLFRGTDDFSNADFINKLARGIPRSLSPQTSSLTPTEPEYLSMFKEFAPLSASIFAERTFQLFVITYPNDKLCSAQNSALDKFKPPPFLTVVEVRLRHGG